MKGIFPFAALIFVILIMIIIVAMTIPSVREVFLEFVDYLFLFINYVTGFILRLF